MDTPGYVWADKGGWRVAREADAIDKGKHQGRIRVTLALGKHLIVDRIYPLKPCDDNDSRS